MWHSLVDTLGEIINPAVGSMVEKYVSCNQYHETTSSILQRLYCEKQRITKCIPPLFYHTLLPVRTMRSSLLVASVPILISPSDSRLITLPTTHQAYYQSRLDLTTPILTPYSFLLPPSLHSDSHWMYLSVVLLVGVAGGGWHGSFCETA